MYKTITLCIYILTVNYSYFAKMLKYCTIICAYTGGLIFRNKLYIYIAPIHCLSSICLQAKWKLLRVQSNQ